MTDNATSLSIQAAGIPHQPITAMLTLLQNAQHFVLTAFGKSKQSYGGRKRRLKNELPLMGVGQGNGAGPAAYAFLSAILIKVLVSLGYGVVITMALSLITFNTVCLMFVDNCDLWQSATDVNETGEDVVKKCRKQSPRGKVVSLRQEEHCPHKNPSGTSSTTDGQGTSGYTERKEKCQPPSRCITNKDHGIPSNGMNPHTRKRCWACTLHPMAQWNPSK